MLNIVQRGHFFVAPCWNLAYYKRYIEGGLNGQKYVTFRPIPDHFKICKIFTGSEDIRNSVVFGLLF